MSIGISNGTNSGVGGGGTSAKMVYPSNDTAIDAGIYSPATVAIWSDNPNALQGLFDGVNGFQFGAMRQLIGGGGVFSVDADGNVICATFACTSFSADNGLITSDGLGRIAVEDKLNINSDSAPQLLMNTIQVLTTQQPAIANASGVLTDDTRAINAILAALRVHGIIGT